MLNQTVLSEEDYRRLADIISRLYSESSAKSVFLFDRSGRQITSEGVTRGLDVTSFASLTAGSVAATEELAHLVGEEAFPAQFHEGVENSIYIATIGRKAILVILFNDRSSIGLVRLRMKKAMMDLSRAYSEISLKEKEVRDTHEDGPGGTVLENLSEEDIEKLFAS